MPENNVSDFSERIDLSTKKPRKSKKNSNPQLSAEQKAAYTVLSHVRIVIEHAISGMKRYTILVQVFRDRKVDFEDDAVGICAELRNNSSELAPGTLSGQGGLSCRAYARH